MTDVSFVVPAWNEAEGIGETLAALNGAGAACGRGWEVVVVDNASTDATAEVARAAGARVVFEPERQIARARNAGARAALGRFLFFVDADTRVSPGLILEAVQEMESGRAVGGGSAMRFDEAGRPVLAMLGLLNCVFRRARLAAGAFLFCRRDAWEGSGGFDERVYASEEIWFSRSLRRWGRPRGLEFVVLDRHPVVTSSRKVKGGRNAARTAFQFALVTLCPWLLRSRRACFLWYRR